MKSPKRMVAGLAERFRSSSLMDFFYENRRLFIFLVVANFLLQFGHRIWSATFNNYAVERLAVEADMVGWIQSAREVPGLLAIGLAVLALFLSELRIVAFSIILLGVGILLTGQASSLPMLFIATIIMSFGFHFFGPAAGSALMMGTAKEKAPRVLGWMRTIGAIAGVIGTIAIGLLVKPMGYPAFFLAVGGIVIAGGVLLFRLGSGGHKLPEQRKARFRKRYWLFYVLAFLAGSRRHILTTFAPFLLVRNLYVAQTVMANLYLANSLINTLAHQLIGQAIARFGERRMLTIAYVALIPVFLGYAYVPSIYVIYGLFALDSVLFSFNAALTTYIRKIAVTEEEITSNMAAQETIGHIAAVVMPVSGGMLWAFLGPQVPFLIGVGIALISVVFAQFIRIPADDKRVGELA